MNITEYKVTKQDLDYIKEQFSLLTAERKYELPHKFAERVRYIDKELTPFPGRFSYDRFPYFKKIVDAFAPDNPIHRIIVMKGNQLGATTGILESVMLYNIMSNPASQLFVLTDEDMAKTAMNTKIDHMIDGAGARKLIYAQTKKAAGSRNTGDTALKKEYPGGYLHAVGGKSPNRFRNFSYKVILVDEIDGMPDKLKGEGTIQDLVEARSDAYASIRKLYFGSTPTIEQTSKIYKLFLEGDQEYFYVPCKFCGKMQTLEWAVWDENHNHIGGIVWENDEEFMPILDTVGYKCPYCGKVMKNWDKAEIMLKGEWRATATATAIATQSFHISPLYNPPGMFSWENMVALWAKCWDIKNNRIRDKEAYRAFRNLKQGLPFKEQNEQIRYEKAMLHKRWGFIRKTVPNDIAIKEAGSPILIVCCSVDVQKDCLFVDVKGYGERGVTWTLDFFSIDGPTETFNGVWDILAEYVDNTVFSAKDGKFYRIAICLVDSGHYTDYVYSFCLRYSSRVYACKGADYIAGGETYKLFARQTLINIGLGQAYHINTTKLKDRISMMLNTMVWDEGQVQPDWYANFPDDFHDDYFKMFEAESKVEEYDKKTNKYLRTIWKAKEGQANHGFDTYVYNLAALEIFADDFCRLQLGLPSLDWSTFWKFARAGNFYGESEKKQD